MSIDPHMQRFFCHGNSFISKGFEITQFYLLKLNININLRQWAATLCDLYAHPERSEGFFMRFFVEQSSPQNDLCPYIVILLQPLLHL